MFLTEIKEAGFNWKNTIIWVKNNWTAGDLQAALGRQYENIILAHKGRCIRKNNYRYTDVWEFDAIRGKQQVHQNQKPIDLLKRCIELYTEPKDIIFVGCMGSGTTGIACKQLDREFIGCEIDKEYFNIAKKRIELMGGGCNRMSNKPIEKFNNNKQFQQMCKWWQHKLFLDDWFITFTLTTDKLTINDGIDERYVSGVCEYEFNNKEATITICNQVYNDDEICVIKDIAELTVIHELLHLKNEYMTDREEDENDKYFHKYIAHQGLEVMAKTLLMTKYNLDYDYFYKKVGGNSGKKKVKASNK